MIFGERCCWDDSDTRTLVEVLRGRPALFQRYRDAERICGAIGNVHVCLIRSCAVGDLVVVEIGLNGVGREDPILRNCQR